MERFTNILVIDSDQKIRSGLKEILSGGGNNTMVCSSIEQALPIIEKKEVGIILISLDETAEGFAHIKLIKERSLYKNTYILIITKEDSPGIKLVKGMNEGAVDYITFPFNPNLIRTKIEVYKSLFFKDQRIGQLLSNIFPDTILQELSGSGKFSPKRIQNGVVLFTDFVDFSSNAKSIKPLHLIKKLEYYFTHFDHIISKYNLEKIKTIGDAYMALSGVTENEPKAAVRACLAAIEIRDFMRKERDIAIATKRDFWEMRIGLHMGPLVAGIIGSSKYSFDVWGDTVNIAARAETVTKRGHITITSTIEQEVRDYFILKPRGHVDIHKRGGSIEMFYLDTIQPQYVLSRSNTTANGMLRRQCGLPPMDFDHLHNYLLHRLRSLLPEKINYHDVTHTLNVEKAAVRFAKLEGLGDEELLILRTAVLFHDAGFVRQYIGNEDFGIQMAKSLLPEFGYSDHMINEVCRIINCTKSSVEPETLLEMIMCDADHDYLGRPDYHSIVKKLRDEMAHFERTFTDIEWIDFQLDFLENKHHYYTDTAINLRQYGKNARIKDLKKRREKLLSNE